MSRSSEALTRTLSLLVILVSAPICDTIAQDLPLQPGERVRLTAPTRNVIVHEDTFRAMRGDTLVLDSVSCPMSDVTWLQVQRGHKPWGWWKGAFVGFLAGVGIGAAAGAIMECSESGLVEGQCTLWGAVVGAPIGLVVGIIGGGVIKTDKWEPVPLRNVSPSVMARRGGFSIGASISF